jgi:hypothetical protein
VHATLLGIIFLTVFGSEKVIRTAGYEIVHYEVIKSFNNDVMCVLTSTPTQTIRKSSSISCANRCDKYDLSSCFGFNFKADIKTCELISNDPLTFGISKDCKFFKVSFYYIIRLSQTFIETQHADSYTMHLFCLSLAQQTRNLIWIQKNEKFRIFLLCLQACNF